MTRFNKMVDGCLIASLIFCQILLILKIKFCCLHCFQTWTRRLSTWLNGSLNQFELKKKTRRKKPTWLSQNQGWPGNPVNPVKTRLSISWFFFWIFFSKLCHFNCLEKEILLSTLLTCNPDLIRINFRVEF